MGACSLIELILINARRACARALQYSLCVCPPFSASIKRLYNTLIMEIGFVLNTKDFQLTDFSEKAYFESYSLFLLVLRHAGRPFYFVDKLTQHIDARFCKSVLL